MRHPIYRILALAILLCASTILHATIEVTDIQHPTPGNADGCVTILAEGETGPFMVEDATGNCIMTNNTFFCCGYTEGSYTIAIVDDYGCKKELTFVMEEQCNLEIYVVEKKNVTVCDDCIDVCDPDGVIKVEFSRNEDLNIYWYNVFGDIIATDVAVLNELEAGVYTVAAELEGFNCMISEEIEIGVCTSFEIDDDQFGVLDCIEFDHYDFNDIAVVLESFGGTSSDDPPYEGYLDVTIQYNGDISDLEYYWEKDGELYATSEDLYKLESGEYCIFVSDGCNPIESECYYVHDCDSKVLVVYDIEFVDVEGDGCEMNNIFDLELIYQDGSNVDFVQCELFHFDIEIQSFEINGPHIYLDNIPDGEIKIVIFDGCNNVLTLTHNYDIDCVPLEEFPGFRFKQKCDYTLGFGTLGWGIDIYDESELIEFGCNWMITWPDESISSINVNHNSNSINIIPDEKWKGREYRGEEQTILLETSSGCQYEHTEIYCPIDDDGEEDGNETIVPEIIPAPSVAQNNGCGEFSTNVSPLKGFSIDGFSPEVLSTTQNNMAPEFELFISVPFGGSVIVTIVHVDDTDYHRETFDNLSIGQNTLYMNPDLIEGDYTIYVLYQCQSIHRKGFSVDLFTFTETSPRNSLNEKENKTEIVSLSPNPFSSDFTLSVDFFGKNPSKYEYLIFNSQGKLIERAFFLLNKSENDINITSLRNQPDGIYTLLLHNQNGIVKTLRMIKIK